MLVAVLNFDAKYLGLSKERNHVTRFHRDPYTHSSPGLKTMLATVNPLKKNEHGSTYSFLPMWELWSLKQIFFVIFFYAYNF